MQFWTGLILGLILGWVIEWIIDWWYWRGGSGGSALSTSYGSDLTRITGINSDYAGRLTSSGVSSVSTLASSTPSVVRSAIGGDEGKAIDAEAWIVEAGGLSGKSAAASGAGSAKPSGSAGGAASLTSSSDSANPSSANPSSGGAATSSKPASGSGSAKPSGIASDAASLTSVSGSGGTGSVGSSKPAATGTSSTSSTAGSARLASSKPAAATPARGAGSASGAVADRKDNLTKIHGVGKVFQGKFYDAGYTTWESVSKLSDAEIRRVIQPEDWQKIETDVWIEEARILAGGGTTGRTSSSGGSGSSGDGDDLTKIHGIGKVYQGKFHDAGIYLWSEVAELSDEKILAIIEPAEWQKIEPEEWKAEARQFAKEKGGDA